MDMQPYAGNLGGCYDLGSTEHPEHLGSSSILKWVLMMGPIGAACTLLSLTLGGQF